jgi:hypothetical protein
MPRAVETAWWNGAPTEGGTGPSNEQLQPVVSHRGLVDVDVRSAMVMYWVEVLRHVRMLSPHGLQPFVLDRDPVRIAGAVDEEVGRAVVAIQRHTLEASVGDAHGVSLRRAREPAIPVQLELPTCKRAHRPSDVTKVDIASGT